MRATPLRPAGLDANGEILSPVNASALVPSLNYARLTEAGRKMVWGTGIDEYTSWAYVAGQPCIVVADGFPIPTPDDMPATYDCRVTSITLRPSSITGTLHVASITTGNVIRDVIELTPVLTFTAYDLTGHTGGGLAMRPGDKLCFYMTGDVTLASTVCSNLNGTLARYKLAYPGGVPTVGQTITGLGTNGTVVEPLFSATVASMPGCLWTVSSSPAFATPYTIPQFPDNEEILYVAIRGLTVPNGETATISLRKQNTGTGAWEASNPVVFDMGAADQVTFGGNNVALNTAFSGTCTGGEYADGHTELTLDTGTAYTWFAEGSRYIQIAGVGTFLISAYVGSDTIAVVGDASTASESAWSLSEAGDAIDVLLAIEQNDAKLDIIWKNTRTGQSGYASYSVPATRSFANAHASAYNSQETLSDAGKRWAVQVDRSSAATMSKIEYGRYPILAAVSSWGVVQASSTALMTPNHVISQLPTYLSPKRMIWLAGAYGGRLVSANDHYGLRQRFGCDDNDSGFANDPVPGIDDCRAIRQATWVIEGLPNDLTSITTAGGSTYLNKVATEIEGLLDLCNTLDIHVVIASTLPRGAGDSTDNLKGTNSSARRIVNQRVSELCRRYGHTFVDCARSGTTAATWNTPYEICQYHDAGNPGHMTTAGDQWLADLIADAINTTDLYTATPAY